MILVVGIPGQKFTLSQEGRPPLFSGYLNLAWDPQAPQHSWITQIQRGDGTPWLPMLESIGLHTNVMAGVTAIKISRDDPADDAWIAQEAQESASHYFQQAKQQAEEGKTPLVHGTITIKASDKNPKTYVVAFYVDGNLMGLTNQPPFQFHWNTSTSPDGEYTIEARSEDSNGDSLSWNSTMVWVNNRHEIVKPVHKK